MRVLVTGGAGYIGSHTVIELLNSGFEVHVVDDLSTGQREVIRRAEAIAGKRVTFIEEDIRNRASLARILLSSDYRAVIHFAGLKSVPESIDDPLGYYDVNVGGTVSLLSAMQDAGVTRLVFSSSAAVYGEPKGVPVAETEPLKPVNPYGRTKLAVEEMLRDVAASRPGWAMMSLRYFNPVGAHPSGQLGEIPGPHTSNVAPKLAQVALGQLPCLRVFGTDYPTPDGTPVRDFIHVMDVASAHVQALQNLTTGARTYNLGTGTGYTIRQLISAFEKACGRAIPIMACPRRPGDVGVSYADVSLAQKELGWKAVRTLDQMCQDAWRWHSGNRYGLAGSGRIRAAQEQEEVAAVGGWDADALPEGRIRLPESGAGACMGSGATPSLKG